ncbi:MAG TPA: hypothetical protein VFX45_12200 [Solirubrobacterales bacterium]|nr:hypothetical protein [Solirubrobacterales bacterium]
MALTKSEFVMQANEICVEADEERKQASEDARDSSAGPTEEVLAVNEALLEPVKSMVGDLEELGVPRGEEKRVGAVVSAFEAGVAKVEAPAVAPLDAFAEANKLALAYGLTDCTI